MTAVIRAELLKLTTIRLPAGLLAAGSVLTAAMALLTSARAGSGASMADTPLTTAAGLTGVLATSYFAMIMAMVLSVTIAAGEYRHATATLTYLATPHRMQVLAAKAVTAFAAGLAGSSRPALANSISRSRVLMQVRPGHASGCAGARQWLWSIR